jgi:hypothetical protein
MSNGRAQPILAGVLDYQRRRSEGEDSDELRRVAAEVETLLEEYWRISAEVQTWSRPGWEADDAHPGYIQIPIPNRGGAMICMPFHLAPANPDVDVMGEILDLASHVAIGRVDGRQATICLSGSTIILKDVLKVGDIDFCEYIPAEVPSASLARVVEEQIRANDLRQCAASVRIRDPATGNDEMEFVSITPERAFTPEQLETLVQLFEMARNGQTFHLAETDFAGVTEVTNWLIIFQEPLEDDPVSALSFAHQEASLGIYGRRPLHTLEAVAAYLSFLRVEIQQHAALHPVKAYKRAISWLRLFGNDELLDELNAIARHHRVTEASAVLAKIELNEKYEQAHDLNNSMQHLTERLRAEIATLEREIVDEVANSRLALQDVIDGFGTECNQMSGMPAMTLWQRILSLANR